MASGTVGGEAKPERSAKESSEGSRHQSGRGGKRGVSAARPAARWRGEVELLDALDEAVVDEGLREARVDLLVHGVQLLVALRRVGGEHAHALLTLASEGGRDGEEREEGAEELELEVKPGEG